MTMCSTFGDADSTIMNNFVHSALIDKSYLMVAVDM